MGREIKFRAWYPSVKKMRHFSDGVIIADDLGRYGMFFNCTEGNVFLSECEVMQFTGLKDKDGKEIYEADILKLWRSVGENAQLRGEYAYPLPVKYCNTWSQFVVIDNQNKEQYGIWEKFFTFEVIGNIYLNPDLLKCGISTEKPDKESIHVCSNFCECRNCITEPCKDTACKVCKGELPEIYGDGCHGKSEEGKEAE